MSEEVRIQKFLADCGVASRRRSEDLIRRGQVRVNGVKITELGSRCRPGVDQVHVGGRLITPPEKRTYILFNKPRGVTTTRSDPHAEQTLMDVVPARYRRLKPVGRLDKWSEGLLLLTDHNELINRMTHPSFKMEKEYWVEVNGPARKRAFDRLERGISIAGDKKTLPAKVTHVKQEAETTTFHITIQEGRKRQVRIMCEEVDYKVRRLRRVRVGPIELGKQPPGSCRQLSRGELKELLISSGLDGEEK